VASAQGGVNQIVVRKIVTGRVTKWGNSLDVRLPASVVEALELKDGDDIEIHAAGARAFVVSRTPDRQTLLERLRIFRGNPDGKTLPSHRRMVPLPAIVT
jgi:antitoxin MazE